MQKAIMSGLFCATLIAGGTANSQVTLQSRNMPTHCEFVFQVHSEIEVTWEQGIEGSSLAYELFHEYDDVWHPRPTQRLDCSSQPTVRCKVSLAFESMSTAQHFLFRKIRFHFVNEQGDALTEGFRATFGREFGEQCYRVAAQTPFRDRVVSADR